MLTFILLYIGMVLFTFALVAAFNEIDQLVEVGICAALALLWPITLCLVAGAATAQLLKRLS